MQISRSEQKRRFKKLGELVASLADLGQADIVNIPCSREIQKLLIEASTLKGGARKRQLKYIVKLLAAEETEPLYDFITRKKGAALQESAHFQELEYMRDQLLGEAIEQRKTILENGGIWGEQWQSNVLSSIAKTYPEADIDSLRQLAFVFAKNRNKAHSREIFRLLRAAQELAHHNS